ncbi:MAG: HEPN domain-containing protein [Myxococcota bacterium]
MPQPSLDCEAAVLWLAKAQGDLAGAEACLASGRVPGWLIGFHCQQAVEKTLKGFLALAGVAPDRTHDVVRLSQLVAAQGGSQPLSDDELSSMTSFAVSERYPVLATPEASVSEVAPLIASASRAVDWLAQVVREAGPST